MFTTTNVVDLLEHLWGCVNILPLALGGFLLHSLQTSGNTYQECSAVGWMHTCNNSRGFRKQIDRWIGNVIISWEYKISFTQKDHVCNNELWPIVFPNVFVSPRSKHILWFATLLFNFYENRVRQRIVQMHLNPGRRQVSSCTRRPCYSQHSENSKRYKW